MIVAEPCCARELIEQAARYAQGLGFEPHPDYKKAARVFGGLHRGQRAESFTFGREGKPFYHRGPRETEDQARRILWQLEKRCGKGNYHYLVALGDSQDLNRILDQRLSNEPY
jgi:hypothetical protein